MTSRASAAAAKPTTPPNRASSAIRRWNRRATWTSVAPIRWSTSIVPRWVSSAARAASTTVAAVAAIIRATRPSASHFRAEISRPSGASHWPLSSIRADGATAITAPRRLSARAPGMSWASIIAGIGRSPSRAPAPSQGSSRAFISPCGSRRTLSTSGSRRSRSRARPPPPRAGRDWARATCTVTRLPRPAPRLDAAPPRPRPAAAASTVRNIMIAITQGIGPASRPSGSRRRSAAPKLRGAALTHRPAAADGGAHRSGRAGCRGRAGASRSGRCSR